MDSGASSLRLLSHLAKAKKEIESNLSDDTMILEALEREINNTRNLDPDFTEKIHKIGGLVSSITGADVRLSDDDMALMNGICFTKYRCYFCS